MFSHDFKDSSQSQTRWHEQLDHCVFCSAKLQLTLSKIQLTDILIELCHMYIFQTLSSLIKHTFCWCISNIERFQSFYWDLLWRNASTARKSTRRFQQLRLNWLLQTAISRVFNDTLWTLRVNESNVHECFKSVWCVRIEVIVSFFM